MSEVIKRYAIFTQQGIPYLGQSEDGAAVMFNDYDKLAKELEWAKSVNTALDESNLRVLAELAELKAKAAPKSLLTEAQDSLYYGAIDAPAEVPYALRQWAMDDEPESTLFDEGYNAARRWVKMQLEKPAEPTEAVEVVGVRISTDGFGSYIADSAMGIGAAMPGEVRDPLMTVAQHKRLMAAKDGDVVEVVELLAKLRQMVCATPKNDIDRSGVWISTKHPVIERIDALLGGAE